VRRCENPECSKALPEGINPLAKYCPESNRCRARAYYLRANNAEEIRTKHRRYARTPKGKAVRKAYEANKSPERKAREKAWKVAYDAVRRAARKAAGIKHIRPADYNETRRRKERAKRRDPIAGPHMRKVDRERYHSSVYTNISTKLGVGLRKCLNRFGEGKEQTGSFTVDGDDSWLDYTKEVAIAILFLVTHNAVWMRAHGYTHALTTERDGDGIPIDFFGNYHLHHIIEQHTFEGRIADPSTRREAIRELWALDNLVLIHKDEHKHYHSNDNQPSNQPTISEEGEMTNE